MAKEIELKGFKNRGNLFRRVGLPFIRMLLCLPFLSAFGHAEERTLFIKVNNPSTLHIESKIDDTHLKDPNGYRYGHRSKYFNRKIIVANPGRQVLKDVTLMVNEKDLGSFRSLSNYLGLDADQEKAVRSYYNFWKDFRFHDTSYLFENNNPFYVLNFWGYTICGNDSTSLALTFAYMGIPMRFIHLNGHVVCEFFFSDRWHVIDGDHNAVYLKLDNRNLAAFTDIISDPFIALRTKAYGKYRSYNPQDAFKNSALFEFVSPKQNRKRTLDVSKLPDLEDEGWSLYPGEKIIFHYDLSPERIVEKENRTTKEDDKATSLGLVELVINPKARKAIQGSDTIVINARYPIYKLKYHGSDRTEYPPNGKLFVNLNIAVDDEEERLSVFCHGTRLSFPALSKGKNRILLKNETGEGSARLTFVYDPPEEDLRLPALSIRNSSNIFHCEGPFFILGEADGIEKVWWQISKEKDFHFIIPNFEQIQDYNKKITLSRISNSFFRPGEPYFFRIRAKRDAVWGDWSPPFQFTVEKPEQPQGAHIHGLESGEYKLQWQGSKDHETEYWVFGSNRLDFIPEIYTETEVTRMENGKTVDSRPNRNLVVRTKNHFCILNPIRHFYRIVAMKGGAFSTPSELIRFPTTGSGQDLKLSPPKVLQTRWKKVKGEQFKNGYQDIYRTIEMELNPVEK